MRSSFRAGLSLFATLSLATLASSVSSCGGDDSLGSNPNDSGGGGGDGSGNEAGLTDGSPDLDANVPVGALDVAPNFTFESGPVRPVAMSPDGTHLFVANTAHASLDVFTISSTGLNPAGSTSSESIRLPLLRAPTPKFGSSIKCPTASASSTRAPRRRMSCARFSSVTSRVTSSSLEHPMRARSSRRRIAGNNAPTPRSPR